MKVIMVMFDSLNRHMLPPYGCDWTKAPNFTRLAAKTVTFDKSYVCSMPCMPARRELHTGRPNFLHRSWGPLEPFDDSMPRLLKEAGISTHLISDHAHYWETGGATYHTQYDTWDCIRGQEGDPWVGQVAGDAIAPKAVGRNAQNEKWHRQDRINRQFMSREEDQPQSKTFKAGIEFIRRNHAADNWMLHLETFDPHEPWFSQRKYKDLYAKEHYAKYDGPECDWPPYGPVTETRELMEHMRYENASLLSMCDAKLGNLLDVMDELEMWKDTMLIVWTDHGFLLGEHELWAKCSMPFYEEIARTPFFMWDPRCGKKGERRQALVQPALDLAPTLLEFFGQPIPKDMLGKSLRDTIASDKPVREAAIFGLHGGQVNVTDGRYVYMRGPATAENSPVYDYTLMPTHMRVLFPPEELQEMELAKPFAFTKGCKTIKVKATPHRWIKAEQLKTMLFDLHQDPRQQHPLQEPAAEQKMTEHLIRLMRECESPAEQYERLGLGK